MRHPVRTCVLLDDPLCAGQFPLAAGGALSLVTLVTLVRLETGAGLVRVRAVRPVVGGVRLKLVLNTTTCYM